MNIREIRMVKKKGDAPVKTGCGGLENGPDKPPC